MKKYILLLGLSALTFNAYAGCSDGEPNCWDCSKANDETSDCTARLDADGTLNITGSGAMKDYPRINCDTNCTTSAPWREYRVQKVIIGENITTVGNSAFEDMTSVTDVQLPSTLTSIGQVAFEGVQITTIDLPEGLKSIEGNAFNTCPIQNIIFPESLEKIGFNAFRKVTDAVISGGVTNLDPLAFGEVNSSYDWVGSNLTKLYCSAKQMEQCKAVGEKTGIEPIEYKKTQNGRYLVGGKQYLSAADLQAGKVFTPKLIYTVEEAMEATKNGDKFHVRLTYK